LFITHNLNFKLPKRELALIDEADFFALENPGLFDSFVNGQRCIGFTATGLEQGHDSVDMEVFDALDFT
jgi:hypothetical protein